LASCFGRSSRQTRAAASRSNREARVTHARRNMRCAGIVYGPCVEALRRASASINPIRGSPQRRKRANGQTERLRIGWSPGSAAGRRLASRFEFVPTKLAEEVLTALATLSEALVYRYPCIDSAADLLSGSRLHWDSPVLAWGRRSRRPKKRGPFHLVPVIAEATWERLSKVLPFLAKPSGVTVTRCDLRSHSRTSTVPGAVQSASGPLPPDSS
jgi:hypothetical protein